RLFLLKRLHPWPTLAVQEFPACAPQKRPAAHSAPAPLHNPPLRRRGEARAQPRHLARQIPSAWRPVRGLLPFGLETPFPPQPGFRQISSAHSSTYDMGCAQRSERFVQNQPRVFAAPLSPGFSWPPSRSALPAARAGRRTPSVPPAARCLESGFPALPKRYRGADQGGEYVVGNMGGIMGVAIAQLRDHSLKGVQHVQVGAGVEIGGGHRRRRVQDGEVADTAPRKTSSEPGSLPP